MAVLYIRLASPPPRAATRSSRRCTEEGPRVTSSSSQVAVPRLVFLFLFISMCTSIGSQLAAFTRAKPTLAELYARHRPRRDPRGIGGRSGGHLACKSLQLSWILISNSGIMQIGRMNFSRSATGRCHHRRRCDGARPSTETAPTRRSPSPSPFSGAVPLWFPSGRNAVSFGDPARGLDRSTRGCTRGARERGGAIECHPFGRHVGTLTSTRARSSRAGDGAAFRWAESSAFRVAASRTSRTNGCWS